QNSRDQVRLGLRDGPAMGGDKGAIVGRTHRKIEDVGWIGPEVTPSWKSVNAGCKVAMMALVPSGAQQWMGAAVVFEFSALNVGPTCIVWAVRSSPGGTDGRHLICTRKVIGIASAAGTGSIRAAIVMTNAGKGMSALSVMIFLSRL